MVEILKINNMKQFVILLMLSFNVYATESFGQLTIETCQEKARNNYPLIKQYGLIEQSESYSISNANKGYLPQFAIYAKATYQSDVTELNGIKVVSNDQYQAYAEVNQTIWDGGKISSQKQAIKASAELDKQKTETDLYTLNDRVNQLFFGSLLLKEQLVQNESLQKELQTNYDRVKAYMAGGIANQADLDMVRVEQLKNTQRRAELIATQKSFNEMLWAMMGDSVAVTDTLVKPNFQMNLTVALQINRPELKMFEAQSNFYESQKKAYQSANLPQVSLFGQTGYGKPGLNMLQKDFSSYYIVGARLFWNFGNLYTHKNNIRKIEINKQSVDIQKQTFLYNNGLTVKQQLNEVDKIQVQIKSDDEIIALRTGIRKTAEVKVENGTLSVSDFLTKLNDENLAVQDKILHEIQLLKAQYNLKNTTNN